MTDRDALIQQVKFEYAQRAERESRMGDSGQLAGDHEPQAYYEKLLGQVIARIENGEFDGCADGREIIDLVAGSGTGWNFPR